MKISKRILDKYGYTEGCERCTHKRAGLQEQRPHTEASRDRIWEEMEKDEEGMAEKAAQ